MGWRKVPTKAGKSAAAPNWSQFERRSQVMRRDKENVRAGRGRIRFRQARKAPSSVVTWPSLVVTSLSFAVTFPYSLATFPSRLVTQSQSTRKSSPKKCNRQAVHRKNGVLFFSLFFQTVTALHGWPLKKTVNKLLITHDIVSCILTDTIYCGFNHWPRAVQREQSDYRLVWWHVPDGFKGRC